MGLVVAIVHMNYLKKIFKAVWGLLLLIRYTREFDVNLLKNKRLALVGPASSAYNTNRGAFIDEFDYVIRINKAPGLVRDGKFKSDIGAKTDILFHSFVENEFSGGGPLNFNLFDELGIQYVINPIPSFFGKRVIFNFYKKYLLKRSVYILPKKPYAEVMKAFGAFRPTTGFGALKMAMEAEAVELYITGFTFFKTPYGDGYRDPLKDVDKNRKYIKDEKIHNPDIEFEQFLKMYSKNNHVRIVLDSTLEQIVKEHL